MTGWSFVRWLYFDRDEGFKLGIMIHSDGSIGFEGDVLAGTAVADHGRTHEQLRRDLGYRWIENQ